MNWQQFIDRYKEDSSQLFSAGFLERWGKEEWQPSQDDKTAAAMLHTQINSRITTQRLGYLDGVEKTALDSVYALFEATRDINDRFPNARHFGAVAWDMLNTRVRPFTAKWHRESERGVLSALDATDEFRAELTQLQAILRQFDNFLLKLYDEKSPLAHADDPNDRDQQIMKEMSAKVPFGIPKNYGGVSEDNATAINASELQVIQNRRSYYVVRENAPDAVGLALSGGGIRSATFSLGVLVALAQRGLMPQIDYLSTVSGGGYIGSFITAFLSSRGDSEIGLRPTDLPFRRESGEAEALRYVRHHCKYLSSGSTWDRTAMIFAQLYGMLLNGLAICVLVAVAVTVEHVLRVVLPKGTLTFITEVAVAGVLACLFFSLITLRFWKSAQRYGDYAIAGSMAALIGVLCIHLLEPMHVWYTRLSVAQFSLSKSTKWLGLLGTIPLITSALATLMGGLRKHIRAVLLIVSSIAAPVFLLGLYLLLYQLSDRESFPIPGVQPAHSSLTAWIIASIGGLVGYWVLFDVNSTSPHRHYRNKLADAFLIQLRNAPNGSSKDKREKDSTFDAGVSVRLSTLGTHNRSPYHLINCALNVPGSKDVALQGRLTDFFLFSPCFSGSPLTGFYPTREWEKADSHLDLGTAMAISGAAAAPHMGLATIKSLSFWLALLNIRLGYWARKPGKHRSRLAAPGLSYLWREMLGNMDERRAWLNLSDGGHIENLGVYELLRRRCKYIIAVDGEEDSKMTFHALTTLQRLASIDLGVRIDINLDDIRLNEQKLSRSHFRFCRIRYPKQGRGSADEFGYLLYVKLSLTGNEGEFIRRYRLDNPAFPHDSTANQFFTEAQFEAYRSLGEHVGDKLFLRAIVGDLADATSVTIEEWFLRLGKGLLDPLPDRH